MTDEDKTELRMSKPLDKVRGIEKDGVQYIQADDVRDLIENWGYETKVMITAKVKKETAFKIMDLIKEEEKEK